ncbi:MAG TPA: hypothetical protein VGB00_11375 [Pyrinomonadaceae bacterium]|jgi:hypothetical protein
MRSEFYEAGSNPVNSNPDAGYFYDGDGRRVRKINATETVVFVYGAEG